MGVSEVQFSLFCWIIIYYMSKSAAVSAGFSSYLLALCPGTTLKGADTVPLPKVFILNSIKALQSYKLSF